MRILVVNNTYQHPGGEDVVVKREIKFLRDHGHTVIEYFRSNLEINTLNTWGKITLPKRMVWAADTFQDLSRLITQTNPDLVHIHNTFIMVSPAVYHACRAANIPVVKTLHNFRLLCPDANFFRDGRVCEQCLHKTPPWPGIWHGCYRSSRLQTTMVATMLTFHRWLKTWHKNIDLFITPSNFTKQKYIEGGIAPQRIKVKPNPIDVVSGPPEKQEDYFLFAGRLSKEKGVQTLLQAWQRLDNVPLKIIGDGPLKDNVSQFIQKESLNSVEMLGWMSTEEVAQLIKKARCVIFPSECYESFGMVVVEAFACGVPVIASPLGSVAETVQNSQTGLHFSPGNADDLADKVKWAIANQSDMARIGQTGQKVYQQKYSPEKNYTTLIKIYQQAIDQKQ